MNCTKSRRFLSGENWISRVPQSCFFGLVLLLGTALAAGQDPPRKKPILIRADETSEPGPEIEVITPNPAEAARNQKIGDFYFKRKNYKAASERYRDAVLYDPKSADRVLKLVRALEKLELFAEAAQACREYIERNPDSSRTADLRKQAERLQAKEVSTRN